MLKVIKILSDEQQRQIREFLETTHEHLQYDVSKYAKGRQRFWIEHEAKLTSQGMLYSPAVRLPRLWNFCQTYFNKCMLHTNLAYTPKASLGLIAYGDVGITKHRDDTYADYPAMSINISTEPTLWGYTPSYPSFKYSLQNEDVEEIIYEVPSGAVFLFNCKNPHRVVKCDPTRYSINVWSISPKCKKYFDDYTREQDHSQMELTLN